MTALAVVRPDLSARTALSKSALVGFDLCQTKAWFEIHDRRPMRPSEKVSFGSALDAATEIIVVGAREGHPNLQSMTGVAAAIEQIEVRDGLDLPIEELMRAVTGFREEILPKFDWHGVATQPDVWADIPGIGEVNGHPDIVLGDNSVWDVKSSARAKDMPSLELGLYALLVEGHSGQPVHEVGYLTWVRSGRGRWLVQRMAVTDEYRRWTWENVRRFADAKALDAQLNEGQEPTNVVFAGGPKFAGLCADCQYAPANGGPCAIAYMGEASE